MPAKFLSKSDKPAPDLFLAPKPMSSHMSAAFLISGCYVFLASHCSHLPHLPHRSALYSLSFRTCPALYFGHRRNVLRLSDAWTCIKSPLGTPSHVNPNLDKVCCCISLSLFSAPGCLVLQAQCLVLLAPACASCSRYREPFRPRLLFPL